MSSLLIKLLVFAATKKGSVDALFLHSATSLNRGPIFATPKCSNLTLLAHILSKVK